MKKFLLILICLNIAAVNAFSYSIKKNDTKKLFQNGKLKIMEINPRTFGARDLNGNGIIEPELGETSGNFISAIDRLDDLKKMGINAVHIMPVTPVGKLKALGTAGSLYALSDFTSINPQFDVNDNNMSVFEEFKNFVSECHKRDIRVIVDLPSCGSYDLFLNHPELFYKNEEGKPVSPSDWLDVFLFKTYNDDGTLNEKLFDLHKKFIDLMLKADVDGIRADVATIKPYEFWRKLISYTRAFDTSFMFLAEASDSWTTPVCRECGFTSYDKLLKAGFDGYYSSYFNFKDWKNIKDLEKQFKFDLKLSTKYRERKSGILSFMTHDEQSPVLIGGYNYAVQVIWMNALLPFNSYFVDGIQYGDNFIYPYANQVAKKTYTDNLYYYVHKGKPDIFNFSREPDGNFPQLKKEIQFSNEFKNYAFDVISKGNFSKVKTNNDKVFAFERKTSNKTVFVIFNKDKTSTQKVAIKSNFFKNAYTTIKSHTKIDIKNNKASMEIEPSGIIILYYQK